MSHFSVVVIGNNVEDQLQPFHEYECTGIEDEYVKFVDATDEVTNDWSALSDDDKSEYKTIEKYALDWHGYERNDNGQFSRMTNPDAKWDWWVVGGRWSNFFNINTGPRKTFDFNANRIQEAEKASRYFRSLAEATNGIDLPDESWPEIGKRLNYNDEARSTYNNHPWVVAAKKRDGAGFMMSCEVVSFRLGHDEYVKQQVASASSPYAIVKDSKWIAKGDMGWWGCSSNEKEPTDWNDTCVSLIESGDPDELLTVVDCHI